MLEASIVKNYPDFNLETEFSIGQKTMLLCGPSGSGKTTMLRCLAGLEQPDRGYIIFNNSYFFRGKKINLSPPLRSTALMSQEDTLFPHLSVRQNMLYSVPRNGSVPALYCELLRRLDLSSRVDCYPTALSGGEKRRVLLARTLLRQPALLLLDEPFTGLDTKLCRQVATLLYDYYLHYRPVILIASHIKQDLINWADQRLTLQHKSSVVAY